MIDPIDDPEGFAKAVELERDFAELESEVRSAGMAIERVNELGADTARRSVAALEIRIRAKLAELGPAELPPDLSRTAERLRAGAETLRTAVAGIAGGQTQPKDRN